MRLVPSSSVHLRQIHFFFIFETPSLYHISSSRTLSAINKWSFQIRLMEFLIVELILMGLPFFRRLLLQFFYIFGRQHEIYFLRFVSFVQNNNNNNNIWMRILFVVVGNVPQWILLGVIMKNGIHRNCWSAREVKGKKKEAFKNVGI